jgi:hypothetical protein
MAATTERETMHALLNALASARIWSTVVSKARPTERLAALSDSIEKLDRSIGDALEFGHELRSLLAADRLRRTAKRRVSAADSREPRRPKRPKPRR